MMLTATRALVPELLPGHSLKVLMLAQPHFSSCSPPVAASYRSPCPRRDHSPLGALPWCSFWTVAAGAMGLSSWPVLSVPRAEALSGGSTRPVQQHRRFPACSAGQGALKSGARHGAGFAAAAATGPASKHGIDPEGQPAVHVVCSVADISAEALAALRASKVLALDCEGVDLSRLGDICLVQLSTPTDCFLFDVFRTKRTEGVVQLLKELLELPAVTKIIHDCKMDADALFHQLGIALAAVHDTQAWDRVLSGGREDSLNNTLLRYGCTPNADRDKSVYRSNPAFWATRPLTPLMIEWATGDVRPLFALQEKQLSRASPDQHVICAAAAAENSTRVRSMAMQTLSIDGSMAGRLVGPAGANIRQLQQRVPGSFIQVRRDGTRHSDVMVYGRDEATLAAAIELIKPYQQQPRPVTKTPKGPQLRPYPKGKR